MGRGACMGDSLSYLILSCQSSSVSRLHSKTPYQFHLHNYVFIFFFLLQVKYLLFSLNHPIKTISIFLYVLLTLIPFQILNLKLPIYTFFLTITFIIISTNTFFLNKNKNHMTIYPCGLIAQWIEHCTGIARSWVRVPFRPEFFSGSFFNCLS